MGVVFGPCHGGSEKYAAGRSELAEKIGLGRKAERKVSAKNP